MLIDDLGIQIGGRYNKAINIDCPITSTPPGIIHKTFHYIAVIESLTEIENLKYLYFT